MASGLGEGKFRVVGRRPQQEQADLDHGILKGLAIDSRATSQDQIKNVAENKGLGNGPYRKQSNSQIPNPIPNSEKLLSLFPWKWVCPACPPGS